MPPRQDTDSECIRCFGKDANKALMEEESGAESLDSSSSSTAGSHRGPRKQNQRILVRFDFVSWPRAWFHLYSVLYVFTLRARPACVSKKSALV